MSIRIAIPEPASPLYVPDALAYNQRALPQYLASLHSAGATPIVIPLHESPQRMAKILSTTAGVVLPGSGADIDPQKYGQARNPLSADPDPARAGADELLIQDAFNLRKPILAICHGAQGLNVWCGGDMIQDLPTEVGTEVDHAPGRQILDAHRVEITPNTRLAGLLPDDEPCPLHVNSSHHQAILTPGDGLIVCARSPLDNVIEAVELAPGSGALHWVLAVQWHLERSYLHSPLSRSIFGAFVDAAGSWAPRKIEESILHA